MCLQFLCTTIFLYHAKLRSGSENRKTFESPEKGKTFREIFLTALCASTFQKLSPDTSIKFFWSSTNFSALPVPCVLWQFITWSNRRSTKFSRFPIIFCSLNNITSQNGGELCDTPSPKRLNQLTCDDRLTEMNEFFRFSFFSIWVKNVLRVLKANEQNAQWTRNVSLAGLDCRWNSGWILQNFWIFNFQINFIRFLNASKLFFIFFFIFVSSAHPFTGLFSFLALPSFVMSEFWMNSLSAQIFVSWQRGFRYGIVCMSPPKQEHVLSISIRMFMGNHEMWTLKHLCWMFE